MDGAVGSMTGRPTNRPEDLWKRVQIGGPDECWPWLGARRRKGYGHITVNRRGFITHRLAYQLANGVDPGELCVLHKCDNPPCCNPAHLFLGTHGDNNRDCAAKRRNAHGERHRAAKLTVENVLAIRQRRAAGEEGKTLAAEFGVTPALISAIHLRRIWRHA